MLAPQMPRHDQCQFVVDPDDPYRYICLHCGRERSLKKQPDDKPESSLIAALLGAAIATILLVPLLESRQAPAPAPVSTEIRTP